MIQKGNDRNMKFNFYGLHETNSEIGDEIIFLRKFKFQTLLLDHHMPQTNWGCFLVKLQPLQLASTWCARGSYFQPHTQKWWKSKIPKAPALPRHNNGPMSTQTIKTDPYFRCWLFWLWTGLQRSPVERVLGRIRSLKCVADSSQHLRYQIHRRLIPKTLACY